MNYHRFIHILGSVLLLAGGTLFGTGCSGGKEVPTDAHPVLVTVQVVPEAAVPGQTVTLAWRFALADGWHLYWSGRNDTGYPPRIDLDLPEGWMAGGLRWPVPERHVAAGDILDHVYHGELVLIQKMVAPVDAVPGQEVTLAANIQWLACKDMCLPGRTALSLTIPIQDRAVHREPNIATVAMDRLPQYLQEGILDTAWEGATFHVSPTEAARLTFMPTEDCGPLADLLHDGRGDRLALRFRPKGDTAGPVRGLIILEQDGRPSRTYQVDFPAVALPSAQP